MFSAGRAVRALSTVVDKSTKIRSLKLQPTPRRSALLSKLRHVGRVHAPEADMRPLLPHRDLLLKSLAAETVQPLGNPSPKRRRPRTGLAQLCEDGSKHVRSGDIDSLSETFRRVVRTSSENHRSRWCRAVTMNAIIAATHQSSKCTVNDVLSMLTSHGILDVLSPESVGTVLDVLVRDRLRNNDLPAALRGEFMSRALETRLSSGAYAQLIAHISQLDLALSLLHRAVAVSVVPTVSMLNDILASCFEHGDGQRARRVVSEMARRNLQPNVRTLELLLARAEDLQAVDAVFSVARQNKVLSPEVATVFLRAYQRVGSCSSEDDYISKCFSIVDWFFERNIGVRRHALDELVAHFASAGRIEAALRAWREMRRGWLGPPSLRSRRLLYASLIDRGSQQDQYLCQRLLAGLPEAKAKKMYRFVLANLEDDERDANALASDCVEDKATVLHRWASSGRAADVWNWVDQAVKRSQGTGIDIRLLLPLLSDVGETRDPSTKLLLKHLSSGHSVCGSKEEVIDRTTNGFWRSLLIASCKNMDNSDEGDEDDDGTVSHDANIDDEYEDSSILENDTAVFTKDSLRESLADLVRVSSVDIKLNPGFTNRT